MRPYFERMAEFGKPLPQSKMKDTDENVAQVMAVMKEIEESVESVKAAGLPTEKINKRGQLTIWQRLDYLLALK